ncbi:MAG: GGDEF domain-containing protein [Chthonomonadales bacterium]|nr:GGDEF domain-containing protein [Chthonomonadales bacterium]
MDDLTGASAGTDEAPTRLLVIGSVPPTLVSAVAASWITPISTIEQRDGVEAIRVRECAGLPDAAILAAALGPHERTACLGALVEYYPATPALVWIDQPNAAIERDALIGGAQDILGPDIPAPQELRTRLLRAAYRQQAQARIRELADTDSLTGLLNRRGLIRQSVRLVQLARRQECPLLVMRFDVRGLKLLNDRSGHPAGDLALQAFGDTVRVTLRSSDLAGRTGGDEFTIVAWNAGPDAGQRIFDRVAQEYHERTAPECIGLSAGWACWTPSMGSDLDTALEQADRRMCEAKARSKADVNREEETSGR